jgi:hypothetical protein
MPLASQFMHAPKTYHFEAIDKILRYLKGTPEKGILMKASIRIPRPMQIGPKASIKNPRPAIAHL